MKNPRALGMNPATASSQPLLTSCLIKKLDSKKQVDAVSEALRLAISHRNDQAALELIGILEEAYGAVWIDWKGENPDFTFEDYKRYMAECPAREADFCDHLMSIYPFGSLRDEGGREPKATFLETRKEILRIVVFQWGPEVNSRSLALFRFLIKSFRMVVEHREGEWLPRKAVLLKEEKDLLLQALRDRLSFSSDFEPERIAEWMLVDNIPDEIFMTLAIARVRNGGVKLARRDIQNTKAREAVEA